MQTSLLSIGDSDAVHLCYFFIFFIKTFSHRMAARKEKNILFLITYGEIPFQSPFQNHLAAILNAAGGEGVPLVLLGQYCVKSH